MQSDLSGYKVTSFAIQSSSPCPDQSRVPRGAKFPQAGGQSHVPLVHQASPPGCQAARGWPWLCHGWAGGCRWHRAAHAAARLPPCRAVPSRAAPQRWLRLRAGLKQSQISFKFLPVEVGANPNQLMFAVPFEITAPGQGSPSCSRGSRQTPVLLLGEKRPQNQGRQVTVHREPQLGQGIAGEGILRVEIGKGHSWDRQGAKIWGREGTLITPMDEAGRDPNSQGRAGT